MKKAHFKAALKSFHVTAFSCLIACTVLCGTAIAEDQLEEGWEYLSSPTGAYDVRFPNTYEVWQTRLHIDDTHTIFSDESAATVDMRPFRPQIKQYIIKIDQTLGSSIRKEENAALLDADIKSLKKVFEDMGGTIIADEKVKAGDYPGEEIRASYPGDDGELQHTRVRVFLTNTTKIQQTIIGPEDIMFAYNTKAYFESLRLYSNVKMEEGDIRADWVAHDSLLNMFTVYLPHLAPPYFIKPPVFKYASDMELASATFDDPIWNYEMTYNAYAYTLKKAAKFSDAHAYLIQRYGLPNGYNRKTLIVKKVKTRDGEEGIETSLGVQPGKNDEPYLDALSVRITYKDNYLFIQEVHGNRRFVNAPFAQSLFAASKFHPELKRTMEEAKAAEEALKAQTQKEEAELQTMENEDDGKDTAPSDNPAPTTTAAPTNNDNETETKP